MLTDIAIRKLATPGRRREIPDGKIAGLYLVVQANSGARSWALRYRFGGVPKKLTIGGFPAIDLANARRLAQKAVGDIAEGKDPAAAKRASRLAAKAALETDVDRVERVVGSYVERHAKLKIKRWPEVERVLTKEVAERWKGRRLSAITRFQIHDMLDSIVDRGAAIRANRVFEQFRSLCKWAIDRGFIDRSPCEGMRAPSPETKRDRVLTDHEMRLVWKACEAIGAPFGGVVRLLILTGARLREVAGMEWAEVDLQARTWTLPKARAKNRRDHVVPLSDAAVEIIAARPRMGGSRFLFSTTGRTAVSGFSNAKKDIDAAIKAVAGDGAEPVPHWTLHDLRRTVATGLQKLGVRLEVTEAVLNHVSGSRRGVVGIYQRHDWADEKRAALSAWGDRVAQIVEEDAR